MNIDRNMLKRGLDVNANNEGAGETVHAQSRLNLHCPHVACIGSEDDSVKLLRILVL